jgi:hypothetical protein
MVLDVPDLEHLSRLIADLSALSDLVSVHRVRGG